MMTALKWAPGVSWRYIYNVIHPEKKPCAHRKKARQATGCRMEWLGSEVPD